MDDKDKDLFKSLKKLGKKGDEYPEELLEKRRGKFIKNASFLTLLWKYGPIVGLIVMALIWVISWFIK